MIPLLLSITFGTGVYLVYEGLTSPLPRSVGGSWFGLAERVLTRVGLPDTSPRDILLVSAGTAVLSGGVAQVIVGWSAVSLLATGLGAVAPLIYLVRRYERQKAALQAAMV